MKVPKTLAIILDGNGRYAEKCGKKRYEGHTDGIYNLINLMHEAFSLGVENFICYALSTENLFREKIEVDHIFELMIDVYHTFIDAATKDEAYVEYIGNTKKLPLAVRASIKKSQGKLKKFKGGKHTLYVCVAYGSRAEIIEAVNKAVDEKRHVDEKSFLKSLSLPLEPDLLIRTGGEKRLSNFLLYQISYAELYFSDKLFPEFGKEDLIKAFEWFEGRDRRYGLINKK